jgi:hypothetical protein
MSDAPLFDALKSGWLCPRCERSFPTVDHRHSFTTTLGGIIECEKATPEQIAEYKKFCEARELRRKAHREEQEGLAKEGK